MYEHSNEHSNECMNTVMNASTNVFKRCVAKPWQNAGYLLLHVTLKHTFSYPTYTYSHTLHTCRLICCCMHSHTLQTHILTPYIHIFSLPTYLQTHLQLLHSAQLMASNDLGVCVLQCVLQCVAVCCSVLQCVAVCCRVCCTACCSVYCSTEMRSEEHTSELQSR